MPFRMDAILSIRYLIDAATPWLVGGQPRSGAGSISLSVTDTPSFSNLAFSAIAPCSTNVAFAATWDSIRDRDLDVAVLAACSILDINDYNGNYSGAAHLLSPGKAWEETGPTNLLGYAYKAPLDAGGAPTRIVQSWVSKRGTMDNVDAWMKANADNRAWNACAIVKGEKYLYFESSFYKKFHRVKAVPKGDW